MTPFPKDAYVVAVWLTEDADRDEGSICRSVQESLKFPVGSPRALSSGRRSRNGPTALGHQRRLPAHRCRRRQGTRSPPEFDYQSVNETNVPEAEKDTSEGP